MVLSSSNVERRRPRVQLQLLDILVGCSKSWRREQIEQRRHVVVVARQTNARACHAAHLKVEYLLLRVLPVPIILIVSSTAALRTETTTTPIVLRGIVVTTSGVAGILLSGIYYLSTSPTFLWRRDL